MGKIKVKMGIIYMEGPFDQIRDAISIPPSYIGNTNASNIFLLPILLFDPILSIDAKLPDPEI